jgi:DNA-binding XRE family transcriptional regulator
MFIKTQRRLFLSMSFFDRKWRLCACRINAGYTQREVAEILGVAEITIINWETGVTAPKMDMAQKLSELYVTPLAYMDFSKEGNKTPLRDRPFEEL